MATEVHHGKNGTFSWTDGTITIDESEVSWVIEVTGDALDITSADNTAYKARTPGFKTWTLTVDVLDADVLFTEANLFGADSTHGLGASAAATLTTTGASTTTTYTASSAILIGWRKSLDATGLVTHTFNFQGAGALATGTV